VFKLLFLGSLAFSLSINLQVQLKRRWYGLCLQRWYASPSKSKSRLRLTERGLTLPSSGRAFGTPLKSNVRFHELALKREPCAIAAHGFRRYNNQVRITYDPTKRDRTLSERGLNFEDAEVVFEGMTVEVEDKRKDYGERRILCFGLLAGRLVVVGYTPRGSVRHVFSMRKANDREQTRLAPYFGL